MNVTSVGGWCHDEVIEKPQQEEEDDGPEKDPDACKEETDGIGGKGDEGLATAEDHAGDEVNQRNALEQGVGTTGVLFFFHIIIGADPAASPGDAQGRLQFVKWRVVVAGEEEARAKNRSRRWIFAP